ncbi:O-methyltransferase [candidate division KSB1 bacterium]
MDIVNSAVEKYIQQYARIDEPVIAEMEEYGRKRSFPIVGPAVGALLRQYTRIIGAKRILELGSGFGYSAAWFFMGTLTRGDITCTEYSDENIAAGRDYMTRLGAVGVVRFLQGDARELIKNVDGPFDIIFNDVDKEQYPELFELGFPLLRRGGLFISDNVLWKGKVTGSDTDEATEGIREFTNIIFNSAGVISTIIPLRDGISVSMKTK